MSDTDLPARFVDACSHSPRNLYRPAVGTGGGVEWVRRRFTFGGGAAAVLPPGITGHCALGWLVYGSRPTPAEQQQGLTAQGAVEQWCTDTSYPQQRAGDALLTAARVLAAVSRGDAAVMTALMTAAASPVQPAVPTGS